MPAFVKPLTSPASTGLRKLTEGGLEEYSPRTCTRRTNRVSVALCVETQPTSARSHKVIPNLAVPIYKRYRQLAGKRISLLSSPQFRLLVDVTALRPQMPTPPIYGSGARTRRCAPVPLCSLGPGFALAGMGIQVGGCTQFHHFKSRKADSGQGACCIETLLWTAG